MTTTGASHPAAPRPFLRTLVATIVAVIVFVVLLPLLLIWLVFFAITRLITAVHKLMEPQAVPWSDVIDFDPELGWRCRSDLKTGAAPTVSSASPPTSEDGDAPAPSPTPTWWSSETRSPSAGASTTAITSPTSRCSHSTRSASSRSARSRTTSCKSCMLMEHVKEQLRDKVVVWLVYVGNDITENLSPHVGPYRSPFVRRTDNGDAWELVTEHLVPEPWPWPKWPVEDVGYRELCCDTYRSRRAYDATAYLIERAQEVCSSVDARLLVAMVPCLSDYAADDLRADSPDPGSFDRNRPSNEIRADV